MAAQFRELCKLDAFEKISDRIARVRANFQVTIEPNGFWAKRNDLGPLGPSIFTNAEMIERHLITSPKGYALTREERQREAASAYGMRPVFGRAD